MRRLKVIVLLAAVLVVSFGATLYLPVDDVFKGVVSVPGVLALIGMLYQIARDESQYLKSQEQQNRQHFFNLGAMSHMANVAFDKHVEFCEKYMAEVHNTVSTLFRNGPTPEALGHAANFVDIRQEFAAWTTTEINENLLPFEQALRDLGATKGYIEDTRGDPASQENRSRSVGEVWDTFRRLLPIEGDQPDEAVAIEEIKGRVREILDIEQLTALRKRLISAAAESSTAVL